MEDKFIEKSSIAFGTFSIGGGWKPNNNLEMSEAEQLAHNCENNFIPRRPQPISNMVAS